MAAARACCCSGGVKLIFPCAGAAEVGAIADGTARRLSREGAGRMFCLAGIGGRVESIVKTARAADRIVAIDGCAQECARHCLEEAGITGFAHVQLGRLGMEKGMSPVTDDAVMCAASAAREMLAD